MINIHIMAVHFTALLHTCILRVQINRRDYPIPLNIPLTVPTTAPQSAENEWKCRHELVYNYYPLCHYYIGYLYYHGYSSSRYANTLWICACVQIHAFVGSRRLLRGRKTRTAERTTDHKAWPRDHQQQQQKEYRSSAWSSS